MTAPTPAPTTAPAAPVWTCPFCPLLCDGFQLAPTAGSTPAPGRLVLQGSDCPRAVQALQRYPATPSQATPQVDGQPCDLGTAIAAAAQVLAASRQPLFGGLGTDVAGARALYRLACATGAISDAAQGEALMHELRALQDRGATTTTLAEVHQRADLIVCLGSDPTARLPEFFQRCGIGAGLDSPVASRQVVLLGAPADPPTAATLDTLNRTAGVTARTVDLHSDLFDTLSVLTALVAGKRLPNAPAARVGLVSLVDLVNLAQRLQQARYAVFVWQSDTLPRHGALLVEAAQRLITLLNRHTRAASLALGGGDGAATVNQVYTWLSGLPLRSRAGPLGLEHEPLCYDAPRLLADGAVDALLWLDSFHAHTVPAAALPRIVIGHPELAAQANVAAGGHPTVFIPVSTPGIGSHGHLFRTDGAVLMPLSPVYTDTLPTAAEVLGRLTQTVQALNAGTLAEGAA